MSISWSRLIIQAIKSFSLSSLSSKAEEEQGLRLRLFLRDGLCRSVDRLLMNQQGNFVHSSSQTNPCKNICLFIWFPFHTSTRQSIEEKNLSSMYVTQFLKTLPTKVFASFFFAEMPVEILQGKKVDFPFVNQPKLWHSQRAEDGLQNSAKTLSPILKISFSVLCFLVHARWFWDVSMRRKYKVRNVYNVNI